ncbi:hypothetical protein GSI_03669 [Ganoderma sinense ZZ0214-1]|uniref:Uncharacterized protein n=1 Tax=Ganoderma sinense ZZ0214-1 TaxID=1077348 RepID=A0A2G8SJL4_9APHY|nr:hypothetical protein GSI_03669 [Ganoderma sinense ZZ0214-1]
MPAGARRVACASVQWGEVGEVDARSRGSRPRRRLATAPPRLFSTSWTSQIPTFIMSTLPACYRPRQMKRLSPPPSEEDTIQANVDCRPSSFVGECIQVKQSIHFHYCNTVLS